MDRSDDAMSQAIDALIDANRTQCLWFMRAGYYPRSRAAQFRLLACITRYGDRAAAQQAASLRQWLSQRSSAESAVS